MSKSLSFEFDPIDQPAATDPVERQSWSALRIRVGHRYASKLWDKSLQKERLTLYLPTFSIADWIVRNWWSLLNELCPWDSIPAFGVNSRQLAWIKRHCLRSSDSALLLPKLYLYHDGQNPRVEWQPDMPGSLPSMPGEFYDSWSEQLDAETTEQSLAEFISDVLGHVDDTLDDRVDHLTAQWKAIQGADQEERDFCVLAGRMGIDPYNPEEMTEILAVFFEEMLNDANEPLVRDLTEVAQPESLEDQWSWVTDASRALELGPLTAPLPFELPIRKLSPPDYGYQLARSVRESAGNDLRPLDSIEDVASAAIHRRFAYEYRNHIPGHGIKAIVGQTNSETIVAAGPKVPHPYNQRFMTARSVFHAIAMSRESQRLVTDAYSWDQKASRAFAAEYIAPQRALINRLSKSTADPQTVRSLSKEFRASPYVIERQLENAGVPLSYD